MAARHQITITATCCQLCELGWQHHNHCHLAALPRTTSSLGVELKDVCSLRCVFGIEVAGGGALGLLDAFPRGPYGRDLLLLGGERAERLGYEVRVRRDHVLPAGRVHHVRCVTPANVERGWVRFEGKVG